MSYHDLKKTAREINFKYPEAKRKRIVDAKRRVRDAERWQRIVANKNQPHSKNHEKAKKQYEAYLKRHSKSAAKYRAANRDEINARQRKRWREIVADKDQPRSLKHKKAEKQYKAYLKRAKKYREAHREEINARQNAKRKVSPKKPLTQKQKIQNRLKQRRYRQKHKKKIQAQQREAYRRKHPNGPGRGKWLRKKPLKAA